MQPLLNLATLCGLLFTAASVATAQDLPPLITPGRDTTRIEGPLNARGYVDYLAAVNEEMSRGVTPENNAAAALVRTLGPRVIVEKRGDAFFRALGIEPLPAEGDYFSDFSDYCQMLRDEARQAAAEAGEPMPDEFGLLPFVEPTPSYAEGDEQFDRAISRPWDADDCPLVDAWLNRHETKLDDLRDGLSRPRFYLPHVDESGDLMRACSVTLDVMTPARTTMQALVMRSNRHIKRGNVAAAARELLAVEHLARHAAAGPFAIDHLLGISMQNVARDGWLVLLHHGKPSAKECGELRTQLEQLPPFPRLGPIMDRGERYFCLAAYVAIAERGPHIIEEWALDGDYSTMFPELAALLAPRPTWQRAISWAKRRPSVRMLRRLFFIVAIDLNECGRHTNAVIDRLVDVLDEPDRKRRAKKLAEYQTELDGRITNWPPRWEPLLVPGLFRTRQTAGQLLFDYLTAQSGTEATLLSLCKAELRFEIIDDQLRLAFAIAAHRADEGTYPERLEQLVPKYVAELPQDPYGEGVYRYRATAQEFVLYGMGENGRDDGGKNRIWDDPLDADEELADADDHRIVSPAS